MIDILSSIIPTCPGCRGCMGRQDWDTNKPRATCRVCRKVYYYNAQGNITMTAKLGKPDLTHNEVAAILAGGKTIAEKHQMAKAGTK